MDKEHIQLAHGGGGQLTAELIQRVILPALGSVQDSHHLTDAAYLNIEGPAAFTTDSYVVDPLEFPGGDIGKLAVCGTVNDLAVSGARPVAISFALVLGEGLEIATLARVLATAGRAAREAGVSIVTGDTKVMERASLTGMAINTSGIGQVLPKARLGFDRIAAGDRVIVSGPLGEHGLAVMCQRKSLSLRTELLSDCAPLAGPALKLVEELGDDLRFMRDPTRGGLAATLVDISTGAGADVEIQETAIPVNRTAKAAAEMLGLDLLTIANEGKLVAVVAPGAAKRAVEILAAFGVSSKAAVIGTIAAASDMPLVEMVTHVGGRRIVQMPYGEELPRIC